MPSTQTYSFHDRYLLQSEIGSGAMGVVYRALDRLTGDTIALKRVHVPQKDKITSTPSKNKNTQIRLALAQEFRTLASMRHPHIISVLDYGFDGDNHPFFTMTLIESLQTILEYGHSLPFQRKANLLIQALQALIYLHRQDIMHCDLKPANVGVDPDGNIKLLDFGLSSSGRDAEGRVGTLAYMAPELLIKGEVSRKTDLYALGMIAYDLFTGTYPFNQASVNQLLEQILSQEPDYTLIPHEPLQQLLKRWLAKNPDNRYHDAQDIILDLCEALNLDLPLESTAIRESFLQGAPFIGRDEELHILQSAFETIEQRQGSVWLIGGESGIGKSRLVEELRTVIMVDGVQVVRGQGIASGGLPFQLWRDILPMLLLSMELPLATLSILKEIVPTLPTLLKRSIPDAPPLSGYDQQQRLIRTIINVLKARSQPLVIILEDIQWTSESLEPLKLLLPNIHELPIMVVATYRDDERPNLPDDLPTAQTVSIDRLHTDEIVSITTAMLGENNIHPNLIQWLKQETEGNIFFLIEIIRALAEDVGQLSDITHTDLPEHILTGTMHTLLRQRLYKLPEKQKPLLAFAAIIGRQIQVNIMQQYFSANAIDEWLYTAEALSIVTLMDGQWVFKHDKIREAVLIDLDADRAKQFHKNVALAIEALYPDSTQYDYVLLQHWHEAGHLDRELHYISPVTTRLIRITGQYDLANIMLKRAVDQLPTNDERRIPLLVLIGECYYQNGKIDEAEASAKSTLALAEQFNHHVGIAESRLILGHIDRIRDRYEEGIQNYQASLEIFQQQDISRGIAIAQYQLGNIISRMGNYYGSEAYYLQSLKNFRDINNMRGIAMCLEDLGMVNRVKQDHQQALIYAEEALAISREIGDLRGLALNLNGYSRTLRANDDYEQAETYMRESLAILDSLHDDFGGAWSRYHLGLLLHKREEFVTAREMFTTSLAIYEGIRDNYGTAICVSGVAFIELELGNTDKAISYFYRTLAIGHQVHVPALALLGIIGLACILKQQDTNEDYIRALLTLAYVHPSTNTDIYFRLKDLPDTIAYLFDAEQTTSTLDLDDVVTDLLERFKYATSATEIIT